MVAVFGTTIAPYLIFWQAAEEVDEIALHAESQSLRLSPGAAPDEFRQIRLDTYVGIGFSNLVGLCIIVTTALTLHANGATSIETAAQAAEALRPIAGPFAFIAFAAGIVGTGLLAVPVLAGSSAYAIAESIDRPVGLGRKPREALTFYSIIAASTLIGVAIHFSPIDPIKALYWSAIVNGIISVPIMTVTMIIAMQPRVMGKFRVAGVFALGWLDLDGDHSDGRCRHVGDGDVILTGKMRSRRLPSRSPRRTTNTLTTGMSGGDRGSQLLLAMHVMRSSIERRAMFSHVVHRTVAYLDRRAHVPWFPFLIGSVAFLVTITLTLPVELLVVISVLVSPARWIAIGLFAAVGSSLASVALYLAFHHLGWNLLIEWYPDIAKSKLWADATRWLSEYGVLALFVLMAVPVPIPKTPALAFVAIYRMPIYEVVLAIGLGKLLKYNVYALIVSRFPEHFVDLYGPLAEEREQPAGNRATPKRSYRSQAYEG